MSSPSNNSSTSSSHHHSQPNTPTSSNRNYGMKAAFRYDPYNNFAKVYVNNTTPTNSRSNSGSTTPRSVSQQQQGQQNKNNNNQGSFDYNSRYEYSNTKSSSSRQNKDLMDEVVMSNSETPTNRAETEQQLHSKMNANNNNNKLSSLAPPTPRSHKSKKSIDYSNSSCSEDEEQHLHNQMMLSLVNHDEQNNKESSSSYQQQQVETPRASVRTMQHLLQNVPYLFLDVVAESTVMCREPGHRVGEHISAWSGPVQSLPQYDGQCIRDVFVAQLPFDLPLSCIQMLADLLIEGPRVHILHASPHIKAGRNYDGCCFVKMYEDDANRFIHAMHKRVLFDVDGVWVATTLPELQELTDYCAWFQEQKGEQRKEILKMPTPFSAMTAEFALRGSRASNNNNQQHHAQQQQQQHHPNNYRNSFHNHGANHHHNNNNNNYHQNTHASAPAYDQNPHQRHFAQHYNYYAQQYSQQQQGMLSNGHQLHHQHLIQQQQQQQYYGGY